VKNSPPNDRWRIFSIKPNGCEADDVKICVYQRKSGENGRGESAKRRDRGNTRARRRSSSNDESFLSVSLCCVRVRARVYWGKMMENYEEIRLGHIKAKDLDDQVPDAPQFYPPPQI